MSNWNTTELPKPHRAVLILTDYSEFPIMFGWRSRGHWWLNENCTWTGKVFGWMEISKALEVLGPIETT